MKDSTAIRFVATTAMASYERLTPRERVMLLTGLSQILPKDEARAAEQAAFMIERAEAQQLKFLHLISDPAHPFDISHDGDGDGTHDGKKGKK